MITSNNSTPSSLAANAQTSETQKKTALQDQGQAALKGEDAKKNAADTINSTVNNPKNSVEKSSEAQRLTPSVTVSISPEATAQSNKEQQASADQAKSKTNERQKAGETNPPANPATSKKASNKNAKNNQAVSNNAAQLKQLANIKKPQSTNIPNTAEGKKLKSKIANFDSINSNKTLSPEQKRQKLQALTLEINRLRSKIDNEKQVIAAKPQQPTKTPPSN